MRHKRRQAELNVDRILVAGLAGIHPSNIKGFALFTVNRECGIHLTTSVCCVYHAVEETLAICQRELSVLVPCSDGPG